jgi:hypothetical protein
VIISTDCIGSCKSNYHTITTTTTSTLAICYLYHSKNLLSPFSLNASTIVYIYTKISRLISERCGLAVFLSGRLLHIYEKQTTWRYNGYRRVFDVDFAEFVLWKVNVYPILCLGLTAVAEWSRALDIKLSDGYINGVSSNPVEERIKICQLKDLILTVWFKFQMYIYIYIYMYINECYCLDHSATSAIGSLLSYLFIYIYMAGS